MTAPTPIKPVEPLTVNDRGELIVKLTATPSEAFMQGTQQYLRQPAARSTAYDSRYFERFEGATMVFKPMSIEGFEKHYLALVVAAIKAGNDYAAEVIARHEAEVSEQQKTKDADRLRIEEERAKAAKVKLPE